MTAPVFGLQFILQDDQAIPVIAANMDVVGIIGPCSSADPTVFPHNTPVLVYSNDTAKLALLGQDGFIPDAVNGINDQLADLEQAVQLVIVVTPYGGAADANIKLQQTIANIMGNSITQTGIWAFMKAPNTLYCTPRLICAPGYTGQMANSLDTLTLATDGVGYTPGQTYEVTFAAGEGETNGANLIMPTAHAVAEADGSINEADIVIDSFGAWMTATPTATLPAPDGPPVTALAATGEALFSGNPGVGATLVLNGTTVTFVSGSPTGNQVQIGANLSTTLSALLTMLNASTDTNIALNSYSLSGGALLMTAKTAGTAGNSFTLGGTVSGMSLSGSTMSGGRNAATAQQAMLTPTIALGANPVCASLTAVCDSLMAHAIIESVGTSQIDDENWRDTLNSKRLIALSGGVKIQDPNTGDIVVMPFAPRFIGAIVARDFATGYPFHSAANTAIQGIVGPARAINFSLTDGATEGQQLLAANIGILVRGLIGVETAISSGGFVAIATDTLSDDPLWEFYNVTRGRDFIHLSLMPALRNYLGRSNIDQQTIANVLTTIQTFLNNLTALQQILGGTVNFQAGENPASSIRQGRLTVDFAAEEPPVLREITTMSSRYAPAINAMVQQLQQQLNMQA